MAKLPTRPDAAATFLRVIWDRPGWHTLCLGRKDLSRPTFSEHWFRLPTDAAKLDTFLNAESTGQHDVYYSPVSYGQSKRIKAFASDTAWLWSDLDTATPEQFPTDVPKPTVVLESSPGRFQALWRLTQRASTYEVESINKGLAYKLGADRNGWDYTQLLRVPGFRNLKYSDSPVVRTSKLSSTANVSPIGAFQNYRMGVALDIPSDVNQAAVVEAANRLDPYRLHQEYRSRLSERINHLLDTPSINGESDRSNRLWELECALWEFEFDAHEVLALVRASVWNKYQGQNRENTQLVREIFRAKAKVDSKLSLVAAQTLPDGEPQGGNDNYDEEDPELAALLAQPEITYLEEAPPQTFTLKIKTMAEWLEADLPKPRWLVHNVLPEFEQCIVSGAQKTLKSFLAKDLAMSVALGTPLFGYFPVSEAKPVLYLQQEIDASQSQDRGRRIAAAKGAFSANKVIRNGPMYILEETMTSIADPDNQREFEYFIKTHGIGLFLVDPLYLSISPADENVQQQIVPIVQWLTKLKTEYGCQTVVFHHFSQSGINSGTSSVSNIRGSTVFVGYFSTSIVLLTDPKNDLLVHYDIKVRSQPAVKPFSVLFEMDPPGGMLYVPHVDDVNPTERIQLLDRMRRFIVRMPDKRQYPIAAFATQMQQPFERVLNYLTELEKEGIVRVTNPRDGDGESRIPTLERVLTSLEEELALL